MRKLLKWLGTIVASLLVLIILAATALYVMGGSKISEPHDVSLAALTLPSDSASLAHGRHLARIHGCQDCHGENFAGQVFIDAPPFRVVASNLTAGDGGIGAQYQPEDWDRAIRHGVAADGRPIQAMASPAYHNLSDEDAAALIAFVRSVEPVDNSLPKTEIRLPGRLLAGAGAIDMHAGVVTAAAGSKSTPPEGPTTAFGAYRASTICVACHGPDLRGAPNHDPAGPYATDLAAAAQWPYEHFATAMQTGVLPGGRQMDAKWMPWGAFRHMTDTELQAIYAYLQTINTAEDELAAES